MNSYPLPEGVLVDVAERPPHGPMLVKLQRSVRLGAEELREISLAPLRAAHVRRIAKEWETTEDLFRITTQLSGLAEVVLDQLSGQDIGAVVQATLAQCWPARDLPANWESAAAALDAQGLAHAIPKVPVLDAGCTLELQHEIKVGKDVVTRLEFRELTGKVAKSCGLSGLEMRRLPWVIEQLTGQRAEIVDQLTGVDLNRALALAQGFFFATRPRERDSGSSSLSASAGRQK